MNTLRPVRLRVPWQSWSKGHVFTAMPAGQAQVLVERGVAEYADAAVPRSPLNRMLRATGRRPPGGAAA